jgi:hypothetical protein
MKLFNYLLMILVLSSLSNTAKALDSCPISDLSANEPMLIEKDNDQEVFIDENRDIKDFGTNIVVKSFFKTPDTLFNFLKLVYGNLDKVVSAYRSSQGLADDAIFLVFKGGNGLRMIANTVFDELPPIARDLLKEKYSPDFKRSDADFSVYINEKKLNNLDYDKVFTEVTSLLFAELDKIRAEFKANPAKYFNFFQFNKDFASSELTTYFNELNNLNSVKDDANETWYNAKFKQLQLLDMKANKDLNCKYEGNLDYRFEENKDKNIVGSSVSSKTDWIANSDNRTLEFPFGSSPDKITKFSLVRSKVIFEYTYEKNGVLQRRPIGGELIDVSLPHRNDATAPSFLDTNNNVVKFSVVSENGDEEFDMKVYSIESLAHDLHGIIFNSFDRPWNGGHKYAKRLNRLMFFFITEMMGKYGLGSREAKEYASKLQEKVLEPLASSMYPITEQSTELISNIKSNIVNIKINNPQMHIANTFLDSLGNLITDLINNPLEGDVEGFKGFLESIKSSVVVASEIAHMPEFKTVDINKVNRVNIGKIF